MKPRKHSHPQNVVKPPRKKPFPQKSCRLLFAALLKTFAVPSVFV